VQNSNGGRRFPSQVRCKKTREDDDGRSHVFLHHLKCCPRLELTVRCVAVSPTNMRARPVAIYKLTLPIIFELAMLAHASAVPEARRRAASFNHPSGAPSLTARLRWCSHGSSDCLPRRSTQLYWACT